MVSPTSSSFYANGEAIVEAEVVENDYTPENKPSQAPSSLFPHGTAYDALANVEDVVAEINGLLADTQSAAAEGAISSTAAQASANAAHDSEVASAASAAAAGISEANAATSAANALTSETHAATSEANALTYKNNASTSATNAATSEANALTYKNNASTSATNAATSETNALASKNAAATSATNAATSETNANTYKNNASTSATNAATSESNALSYKNSANTSATNAATSEANALSYKNAANTSATNAATSETNAATSASTASTAATNAQNSYNSFRGIYYGSNTSDPALDPNGAAPGAGDFYFNTTTQKFRAYSGTAWADMVAGGQQKRFIFTATAGQTSFSGTDTFSQTLAYTAGSVEVILNGLWLPYSDYTATNGTSVVLNSGSAAGDVVYVFALSNFSIANALDKTANGSDILNAATFRSNIDTYQKSANGSDIPSVSTFRTNLGLGPFATAAAGQLPGQGSNTQPTAGMRGYRLTSGGSANYVSGTAKAICFIDITAGVWDIEFMNVFGGPGATTSSDWWTNLNSVSDTIAAGTAYGVQCHTRQPAGADMSVVHTGMRTRIAVTTTTRVYLNGQSTYSGSSYSSSGSLQATLVN